MADTNGVIKLKKLSTSVTDAPSAGYVRVYVGADGHLKTTDEDDITKDYDGLLYNDEKAQDAVGGIMVDTATVNLTYDDSTNEIKADVIPSGIPHSGLSGVGTNSHAQIDSHIANTSNPHNTTAAQVGADATGTAAAAVVAHEAALNPHAQYLTQAEGDAAYDAIGAASAAVSAHEGLSDPHPQYLTPAEGNAAYPALATSINTAANSGLSGGGDLSANRNHALDITNLVANTDQERSAYDDLVAVYDTSATSQKKIKVRDMLKKFRDQVTSYGSDFIVELLGGLTSSVTGTGASAQVGTYGLDAAENCRGILQIDTGTTAAGSARIGTATTSMFVGAQDYYELEMRTAIEAQSSPTDEFTTYLGFTSNLAANGLGNQFVGFRYKDSVNGGKYEFVVQSGGVIQATIDTGVLCDINYHIFKIIIDGATGTAYGYIDGALVATWATGVPSGSTQTFGFSYKIEKSVGLTQRNADLDWFEFNYFRSIAR